MRKVYQGDQSVRKVLSEIIGFSPSMVRLRRALRRIAKGEDDVMITGEPGTGKRFLAKKIHQLGSRRTKPFVEVDGSAFVQGSEELLTSLMDRAREGLLAIYRLEEMPAAAQVQLYHCLVENNGVSNNSSGKYLRARIITTCEVDVQMAIEKRLLNPNLYYRLNRLMFNVPPLRNRKQDIPHLFAHFFRIFIRITDRDADFTALSNELHDSLMSYEWPGNVEELENIVRTLVVTAKDGNYLPEALPFLHEVDPLKVLIGKSLPEAIAIVESYLLRKALGRFDGNQTKAAQYLHISEASLRYKLKKNKIANK